MKKLIFSVIGLIFIIIALVGLERGSALGMSRGSGIATLDSSPIKFYFSIGIQLLFGATSILYAIGTLKDK